MTVLQSNKEQGLLLNKLDPSRRDQSRPLPFSYNELDLPTTLGETIYVYVKSENGIIATSFKFQYDSDIGKVVMKRS